MRIAILSRNKQLHSVRRLLQEASKAQIQCDVINPLECQLVVDGRDSRILVGANPVNKYDAILPRIGASITEYGLAVVKHFETLGNFTVNSASAIAESRDKLRCLQTLTEAGIQVPATVLSRSIRGRRAAVEAVNGMPVVLKVLKGTQGVGVMLMHTPISLGSVLDTLNGLDQDVIIQQFLAEGAGRDYRAFVVGNRVVAAMMRTAPEGEFRSNIHRGGEGALVKLPKSYERVAIKAVKVLGLEVAGVDLMSGMSRGRGSSSRKREVPMVIEVNSSPGFEGIERATGLNIAQMIVKHMITRAKIHRARSSKKRRR